MAEGALIRPWDELVEEGRRVLGNASWELGDLANEVEGTEQFGAKRLQNYAIELGVKYEQLAQLRRVARRFPKNTIDRSIVSWTVAYVLAGQEDRFELIAARKWTAAEARELVKHRTQELEARKTELEVAQTDADKKAVQAAKQVSQVQTQIQQLQAKLAAPTLLTELYQDIKTTQDEGARLSVLRWAHESGEHDGVSVDDCALCQAETKPQAPLKLYMKIPEVWQDIRDLATQVQASASDLSPADRQLIIKNVTTVRAALDLIESTAIHGSVTEEALQALIAQANSQGE